MSRMANTTSTVPGFTPPAGRMDTLRERRRRRAIMRHLHDGDWFHVLITLASTAHRFREVRNHQGKLQTLFTKVNLIKRAVEMHADVMAGREPTVSVPEGNGAQRESVDGILRRSLFPARWHEAAVRMTVEAEAPIIARFDPSIRDRQAEGGPEGAAYVELGDNGSWLPVGGPAPDGQPSVWERRWIVERTASTGDKPKRFLRVERHRLIRGVHTIEQEAYTGKHPAAFDDLAWLTRAPLAAAFDDPALVPEEITETGLRTLPIAQLVRYRDMGEPAPLMDDRDIELVDALSAAWSRLDRVNELHGNAMLRASEQMLDQNGELRMEEHEAVVDPDKQVGYILAEYQFEEMLKLVDRLSEWMLAGALAVSPSLIGMKLSGGASPDSFEKLRLEAMNTLTANQRAVPYVNGALSRVVTAASELESGRGGETIAGFTVVQVSVSVHPELPRDEQQRIRDIAEQQSLGMLDRRSALEEAWGSERAELILERIEAEEAAQSRRERDSLFGAAPPMGEGGDGGEQQGEPAGEAAGVAEPLTGVQIERAIELAERVRNGLIALETAVRILARAIGISESEARTILSPEVGQRSTFEIEREGEGDSGGGAGNGGDA